MDQYQSYIYCHHNDGEIVYIGVGTGPRAFYSSKSGHRKEEHSRWLESQYNKGNIPVKFLEVGLAKKEALLKEEELIRKYTPKFNKLHNPEYNFPTKWEEGVVDFVKTLRDCGYSYNRISYLVGGDSLVHRENTKTMTIWRMVNE